VEDIRFTGMGCAISQASASLMTLKLKGKSRPDALQLLTAFTDVVTTGLQDPPKALGDLKLMAGVRNFPQRVKCAMLAWRAFEQATQEVASTGGPSGTVCTDTGAAHPM
jgi:nitrogen fixation NifU-like protein